MKVGKWVAMGMVFFVTFPCRSVFVNERWFLMPDKLEGREIMVMDMIAQANYPSLLSPKSVFGIKTWNNKVYLIHSCSHMLDKRSDFVSVIHGDTLAFEDPILIPDVIDVAFQDRLGYFLTSLGYVKVMDIETHELMETIHVGSATQKIQISKDNSLRFGSNFLHCRTSTGQEKDVHFWEDRIHSVWVIVDDLLYLSTLVQSPSIEFEIGVYELPTLNRLKIARMPNPALLCTSMGIFSFMNGHQMTGVKLGTKETWTADQLTLFESYMGLFQDLYKGLNLRPIKRYKKQTYVSQAGRLVQMEVMSYLGIKDSLNFILSFDRPTKESLLASVEWEVKRKKFYKRLAHLIGTEPNSPLNKEILALFLEIQDPLIMKLVAGVT